VDLYLGEANGNATKAATGAGYSKRSAASLGSKTCANPAVRAAISERLDELAMTSKEVLGRLAEQGRALYADFIDEAGIVDLKALKAAGLMRLVKKISGAKAESRVVEFYDSQSALVWVGKHHRLFTEKVEADVKLTGFEGWSDEELDVYARTGKRPRTARTGEGTARGGAPAGGAECEELEGCEPGAGDSDGAS